MSVTPRPAARRGRPSKYGRPAHLVAFTLPDDVVDWLKSLHHDPAWAIVKLHQQHSRRQRGRPELAELVQLPHRRALILVNTEAVRPIPGVSIVPLADGRGFLALDAGRGVADLELAVIDRLETRGLSAIEMEGLTALRDRLREWRKAGVRFEARSIVIAVRGPQADAPQALTEIRPRKGVRDVA